mmetsp:Transcript_108673/g.307332  ORF Transcript_108673/g.307332 Transcript_108673/m.307332 type:complete len:275 (-) Transcript_108673:193-1017(-)
MHVVEARLLAAATENADALGTNQAGTVPRALRRWRRRAGVICRRPPLAVQGVEDLDVVHDRVAKATEDEDLITNECGSVASTLHSHWLLALRPVLVLYVEDVHVVVALVFSADASYEVEPGPERRHRVVRAACRHGSGKCHQLPRLLAVVEHLHGVRAHGVEVPQLVADALEAPEQVQAARAHALREAVAAAAVLRQPALHLHLAPGEPAGGREAGRVEGVHVAEVTLAALATVHHELPPHDRRRAEGPAPRAAAPGGHVQPPAGGHVQDAQIS